MRDSDNQYEFTELFLLALQGRITPEQFKQLDLMLSTDPAKIRAYVELMEIYTELSSAGSIEVSCKTDDTAEKYDSFLHLLTNEEKTAPAVTVPQKKPMEESIQKMDRQSIQIRINRGSLITLVLSMAAMLLFALIIRFVPSKTGIEVATLTDSIKAKWADAVAPMGKGTRLVAGSRGFLLREGIAQIEFDNQVKMTIESPAEFEILTGDQVKLNYGRLYAAVPQSAIGFAVQTQSARIIDLGTEFGIDASAYGDNSLHVIKGKTALIAGQKTNKVSIEVKRGVAKKVLAATQTVSDISCNDRLFVRMINSANELIWRGESEISLADIIANGNGFGTGLSEFQITCKKNPAGIYVPINTNHYVDYVFVPNMKEGAPVISSTGLIFHECPETSGDHLLDFSYGNAPFGIRTTKSSDKTSNKPALFMNTNAGITFDLETLRVSYPEFSITGFTSKFGIKDDPELVAVSKADMWILVDGQLVYSIKGATQGQVHDIYVPLSRSSRYLTLVVTEAADDEDMDAWFNRYILGDLCVFGNPSLNIMEIENN